MKRLLSFFLTAATLSASIGCAADRADDPEASSNKNTSNLTCDVRPGEDVCARPWTNIAEPKRAKTVAALELVATFAGAARDALEILHSACGTLLDDAGIERPPLASDADASARARMTCRRASSAFRGRGAALSIHVEAPACFASPSPSCARDDATRSVCAAPKVTVQLQKEDDDGTDRLFAESLERNLGPMLQVKSRALLMAHVTGDLTRDAMEVSSACIPTTHSLLTTAVEEIQLSLDLSAELTSALGAT
jgi:hypothetical protein